MAAAAGAREVALTDYLPGIVDLLKKNIERNKAAIAATNPACKIHAL